MRPAECLLASLALAGCGDPTAVSSTDEAAPPAEVEWMQPLPAQRQTAARLLGRVVVPAAHRWVGGPPVASRLLSWSVREGQVVQVGEPLAVLVSPELGDLASVAAELRRVVAERSDNVERLRAAVESGFRAAEVLYEAERLHEEAAAQLARVQQQVQLRRKDVRSGATGEWSWLAPISGVIAAQGCPPGGLYDASDACLTLIPSDGPRLEVALPVAQRTALAPALDAGTLSLRWLPEGGGEQVLSLDRCQAGLDPQSQTQVCWFVGEGLLLGAAGAAELETPAPAGAVVVPRRAVVRVDGQDAVFVEGEPPRLQPVTVLGREGADLLIADPAPGERIAGRGAFALKSLRAVQ